MSAHQTHATPHDDPGQPAAAHAAATQGYREVLHGLITIGADFARLLHSQATAQAQAAQHAAAHPAQPITEASPAPAPDTLILLAAAFDSVARAVRRGILLARSLDKPVPPAHDPAGHRATARRRIIRAVEDAIQRPDSTASDGRDSPDTLRAELHDRLDTPDLDRDITTRSAADIITEICRDLGIAALPGTRPWQRRKPDDIRQLCARAAAPNAIRQPGPGPQAPRHDATPCLPDPQPGQPAPVHRAQPGPDHPGSTPPEDPAETIAMILRHSTRTQGRWHPPPSG